MIESSPFIFEASLPFNGTNITYRVIYLHQDSYSKQNLVFTIKSILNVRVPPQRILFICPSGLEHCIREVYEKNFDNQYQVYVVDNITVLPYGIDGKLIYQSVQHLFGNGWDIWDNFLDEISHECIERALKQTKTISEAPHGYKYQKPSKQYKQYFVRAGNMLKIPDLSIVFCLLILRKIPKKTNVIYIDSFTIYSFALRLQSLIRYFSQQKYSKSDEIVVPKIEIFHSYDIEPNFHFPKAQIYCLIISASTSGELAKKLIQSHSANKSRIVHLLGIGSNDNDLKESSIYFKARSSENESNMRNCRIIGIDSEEFIFSQGPPIPVSITEKHVLKKELDRLEEPFYQKSLQINKVGVSSGYGPHSLVKICFDTKESLPNSILDWLKFQLVHEMPTTVKSIVHMDDEESRILAKNIHHLLEKEVGLVDISLVSKTDFTNCTKNLTGNSTVVIVANDDPDFEQFRAMSIALRSYPKIFRHFVICHAFPNSSTQHQNAVEDLKFATELPRKYGWSEFMVIPVGSSESFDEILADYGIRRNKLFELMNKVHKNSSVYHGLQMSGLNMSSNSDLFFPTLLGKKLELRRGSIFLSFDGSTFEDSNHKFSQHTVYLAVSSTLQRAREWSYGSNLKLGFDENPFIRTVISPNMFERFNDGIIQASFLRALTNAELDFSGNRGLSRRFSQITNYVIKNSDNVAGEAVLEFLAAVAKKKVLLADNDFEIIENSATSNEELKIYWDFFRSEYL